MLDFKPFMDLVASDKALVFWLLFVFTVFQLWRVSEIKETRHRWFVEEDTRFYKYTFWFMFFPSKHNSFGFDFPDETRY